MREGLFRNNNLNGPCSKLSVGDFGKNTEPLNELEMEMHSARKLPTRYIRTILPMPIMLLVLAVSLQAAASELVFEFGGNGSADGQFSEINGIAVTRDGKIYVVDSGNARIQVFNPDGSFDFSFGTPGTGPGEFDFGVCGIAISESLERVYVSEGVPGELTQRVQVFGLDGTFQFEFGTAGAAAGEFDTPCQMAIGEDDTLFVVDRGNSRVQVFNTVGAYLRQFGTSGSGDGQFNLASGIAIDLAGRVYVADSFTPRIQVFNFAGAYLETFGSGGSAPGEFSRPCHLAQGGTLMVADALNERVQVFTLDGHFQLEFPVTGSEQSIFCSNIPTALATDRLGRIYVEEGNFVRVYSIDRDGDGLLDIWETNGIDADADGVVDLAIHQPPYNADPNHKDLYLEFDWDARSPVASQVVREMKQTLCAAPVYAGGVDNPDGEPGIRLHVDTGALTDPQASEFPRVPCSCSDGIDNDGDGLSDSADPTCQVLDPAGGEGGAGLVTCGDALDNDGDGAIDEDDTDCPTIYDAFATEFASGFPDCGDGMDNDGDGLTDSADPDCMVGDDLGGGNALTDPGGGPFTGDICNFDTTYYAAKADNFDPLRALVFRYAMQTPTCDLDGDGVGDTRSRAELGGNDIFMSTPALASIPPGALISAASYVHELGHNLNLAHGGDGTNNCEPNYISIMNYDHGQGVSRVVRTVPTGGLDFSPVRFPGGRGGAPLPPATPAGQLDENGLDEALIMDPSNRLHQFVFVNALGEKIRAPLNGDVDGDGVPDGTDWNGDGAFGASGLAVNVDTGSPAGRPEECINADLEVLTGYNDWRNMSLPFRQFGNLADGPVNATQTPEPTQAEALAYLAELNNTDLAVALFPDANPIEVGGNVTLEILTENLGPNPADQLALSLSSDAAPLLMPAACEETAGGVQCTFGPLPAGADTTLPVTLTHQGACTDGVPPSFVVSATVENVAEPVGEDPDTANNLANVTIHTVDSTPPEPDCALPAAISPDDAPFTVTPQALDACDAAVSISNSGFQCYRYTPNGKRKPQPCRVESNGGAVEVWRTGGVDSVIEWTLTAEDASGNVSQAQCLLSVENPTAD